MIKATDIRKYQTDKKSANSEFRIEKEYFTSITACYSAWSGALKCWILDHVKIPLRDSAFRDLVYRNMVKVFSGEESDWQIARVNIFPDEVVVTLENDDLRPIVSEEIMDAHLEQLGMDVGDSRLDDDSPDFDDELLAKVMQESEEEYDRRILKRYPELSGCMDDIVATVDLRFTGPTYIHLTEKVRSRARDMEISYKIELRRDKKCNFKEIITRSGCGETVCDILFYWEDPVHKIMTGEVYVDQAAFLR